MHLTDLPDTDHRLLVRIRDSNDREAWEEFVAVYKPLVYRVGRRHGLQDADAQNLVQEVLRKVAIKLNHATQADAPALKSFRRWLTTVARNSAIDTLRRIKPDAAQGGSDILRNLQQVQAASSDDILASEMRREAFRWAARRIRDEFTDTTWIAFWQTMVEGKSCSQVAEELGKTLGAIYTARSRVVQRLKTEVQRFDWDSVDDDFTDDPDQESIS